MRQKVLDPGRVIFTEKGYLTTEVADIVTRVPITKGALYHHFGGKKGLFEEASIQISRDVHEASSERVRHHAGDAWKQLLTSIEAGSTSTYPAPKRKRSC